MSVTFEDLMNMSVDEVPKPQNLPRGHYVLALRGVYKRPPREEGKSGQLSFSYEVVEPTEDVDPNEIVALGEKYSIKDNKINTDFWLATPADLKRIFDHISVHGVEVEAGVPVDQLAKKCVNRRVVAYVAPDNYIHQVKGEVIRDKAQGFKTYN